MPCYNLINQQCYQISRTVILTGHFCKAVVTRKLERVQERALRAVFNYTAVAYEQLLKWADIPSLENRRSSKLIVY